MSYRMLLILAISFHISSIAITQTQEVAVLEQGKAITQELSGTTEHSYKITLQDGQYTKVIVEQLEIDVVAKVFTASGKAISDLDSESRIGRQEKIEIVSDSAAEYQITIKARYPQMPVGKYKIHWMDVHNATKQERILEQARRLDSEALQSFNAGEYQKAINLGEKSLSLTEETLESDDSEIAHSLFRLGKYYRNAGEYPKAEQSYLRAQNILEKKFGLEDLEVSFPLNNLGFLYYDIRDYSSAEPLYERSLMIKERVMGSAHPLVAATLTNMGLLQWKKGDYLKAQNYFQQALKIFEKTSGPESTDAAMCLHNLGIVFKESGDYIKGEQYYKRALQNWEATLGKEHPKVAMALESLGILYRDKGDYANAETFLKRAIQIEQNTEGADPNYAHTLVILALLYEAKGDISNAIEYQSQANAIEEKYIPMNISIGPESRKLDYFSQMMKEEERRISLHIRSAPDNFKARDLAATSILQRKGRVLDAMSDTMAALRHRLDPEDEALMNELDSIKAEVAQLALSGPQGITHIKYEQKLSSLEKKRDKLESEISRRGFNLYQPSQPVTLEAIRAEIPENAALIEFAAFHPSNPKTPIEQDQPGEVYYVAYVIRRDGEIRWQELGSAKEIESLVNRLRQSLSDPERKDVQQAARKFDERIMQQIRLLAGDATQLLISPDGMLNLIPFEALVDEDGHYLVEHYSVIYLSSGRDLLRMRANANKESDPVIFANPMFGDPELTQSGQSKSENETLRKKRLAAAKRESITTGSDLSDVYFMPLASTAQEARAIKSLFVKADVLTGTRASESSLKKVVAPRILHIATHGFFLTDQSESSSKVNGKSTRSIRANVKVENPLLRSGLALAGANLPKPKDDDGILTALEASSLNLWGTKMVTLSACDTGLGEVKNGEGVYGLRRAFILAGTETLVMSLWGVNDYVTRELMTRYYKGLKEGLGRGEALRKVKLIMLKDKRYRHPYYWASFIQSGEWANLDGNR
jgi:CHAT domain-containing protein/tetratricopeptide (TPR) repeat protein